MHMYLIMAFVSIVLFTRLGSKPVQRFSLQLKEASARTLRPENQRLRTTEDEHESRATAASIGIKRNMTRKERNRKLTWLGIAFYFKQV